MALILFFGPPADLRHGVPGEERNRLHDQRGYKGALCTVIPISKCYYRGRQGCYSRMSLARAPGRSPGVTTGSSWPVARRAQAQGLPAPAVRFSVGAEFLRKAACM
jgi:hypothetical protein